MFDAFSSISRYLDVSLNVHIEQIFQRIYPAELQFNKANVSDTKAAFFDLNLSIHNDKLST